MNGARGAGTLTGTKPEDALSEPEPLTMTVNKQSGHQGDPMHLNYARDSQVTQFG
jgi:hypothetical protein